jgi:Tfp pilus assembly protein PilO
VNRKPAIIAGLVGLGLILVMVVGLISPKASQVRKKQKEVQAAQQQEGTLRTQLEQLQAAAKDAPKDRRRLSVLQRQIPPVADLPGIIRMLNNTSDKSAVDFMTLTPGQPTSSGQISVIPVQITVEGGFFAVDQYLYLLEHLPRVSKVTTLAVTPGANGLHTLQLQLAANFFTTDTSAGPGSAPGPTQGQLQSAPSPAVSPTPGG